jgi:hypothetical protein
MWRRHHEIVDLHMSGFKGVDIAKILNIDPQTVSNTINSILGEAKIEELSTIKDGNTKLRMEQIRILTDKAIDVYHEILDNEAGEATLKDRKEAADLVLKELSGLRVPTVIKATSTNLTLTGQELTDFKARGLAAMREAGLIAPEEPKQISGERDVQ